MAPPNAALVALGATGFAFSSLCLLIAALSSSWPHPPVALSAGCACALAGSLCDLRRGVSLLLYVGHGAAASRGAQAGWLLGALLLLLGATSMPRALGAGGLFLAAALHALFALSAPRRCAPLRETLRFAPSVLCMATGSSAAVALALRWADTRALAFGASLALFLGAVAYFALAVRGAREEWRPAPAGPLHPVGSHWRGSSQGLSLHREFVVHEGWSLIV